jgi:hypothetical protein
MVDVFVYVVEFHGRKKKKKTLNCIRQSISRRAGPFPGWREGCCCEGEEEVNFKLLLRGCRELAKTRFSLPCCKANCLQHPPASSQPATCTHKCNMLMQTAADADDERITPSIPHPHPQLRSLDDSNSGNRITTQHFFLLLYKEEKKNYILFYFFSFLFNLGKSFDRTQ